MEGLQDRSPGERLRGVGIHRNLRIHQVSTEGVDETGRSSYSKVPRCNRRPNDLEHEVQRIHTEVFYGALKSQNYAALEELYSDDYMLVRPDYSVLNKKEVLQDLRTNGLTFHSIELRQSTVRIYGSTAVLTGEGRTVVSRNGIERCAHFRLVAVYAGEGKSMKLVHFQSTLSLAWVRPAAFLAENRNIAMEQTLENKNKAIVLEAFDAPFNRQDYAAAEKLWSPHYIQHSAHIEPGREGLFNLVKSLPPTLKDEPGTIVADGDFVIVHGRFSGFLPVNWIAADILRIKEDLLAEHWDVIQDEATKEESKSGLPMFGAEFPKEGGVELIRKVEIERFTLTSSKPFDQVVAALNAAVGHPDMAEFWRSTHRTQSVAELKSTIPAVLGTAGLMLFVEFDHGVIVRKGTGRDTPRIIRFVIGNPLIMKEMAKHVPDAGAYAPVTVLVDERADGVHLSYDRMASLLSPYGNPDALEVARNLDMKVEDLLRQAAA